MKTIISKDPALKKLLRNVKIIAPTDISVLIAGETGTGKELIAFAIQKYSRRSDTPFITLNCAALPENIIESELFGYLKGSFTGADSDKQGIFEAADGGTLFLDEVNSLPVSVQAKLLRFIESGEYLPVGAVKTRTADVRIIAATNADLPAQIRQGDFREDLYFRLSVALLKLPPLRERPKDISLLIDHYLSHFAQKYAVRTPSISKEALERLQNHPWPGNIRELRNLCENLAIRRIRRTIQIKDLPGGFLETKKSHRHPSGFELPEPGISWHELEADLIRQALKKADGKYKDASRLLGISRDTLYYRIKKYGLSET